MTCKYCGLELNLGGLKYPEVRVRLHYSMVHGSKDLEIEEPRVAYVSEGRADAE